jgi:hypothetical protein
MSSRATFVAGLLLVTAFCFCQTSPEEAAAKLRAKQEERDAQRAKFVQITAGELEDLRAEVQNLKNQNADLQRRLADAGKPGAAAAAAPKKRPTLIEVGMTRKDVDDFIRSRRDLRVVSVSSDSGVRKNVDETIVKRQGTGGSTTITNGNRVEVQKGEGQEERQTVEHVSGKGKIDKIVVAHLASRQVVTGSHRNSLGQLRQDYGPEQYEDGHLEVELIDDVVTAVKGTQR